MREPLRVLMVEDSADDAELMSRELRRAGFDVRAERVETREALERALAVAEWDLVIADYSLPAFSGLEALKAVQARQLEVPFIIVSGAINEETAVAAMKSGAHDYVLKDNLARLVPAVSRELREAKLRREQRQVQGELAEVKGRAAAEQQRSREQLEIILRGVAEAIVAQDAAGNFVYANDVAARLVGLASASQLLASSEEELQHRFEFFDESGRPLEVKQLPGYAALASGKLVEALVQSRPREGGEDRWYLVTSTPIFDEQRQAWMTITVFRDVTEPRRDAAASGLLAEASAQLASSLDYSATLTTVARLALPSLAQWCFVELPGQEAPELSQREAAHVDPEKEALLQALVRDEPEVLERLFELSQGRQTCSSTLRERLSEEELLEAAGDPRVAARLAQLAPRSALTVPLTTHDRICGTMTFVSSDPKRRYSKQDLPLAEELARRASMALENARLYQRTRELVRAREEFLAVASHELRTPLTSLTLQLQRMQRFQQSSEAASGDGRTREKLDHAVRQTQRLANLIESLLDVSRVALGRFTLQREELDFAHLVHQVVERSAEDALAARCAVQLSADRPITGQWDRVRVEQVITNLLSNAIKYGHGKPVEVTVEGDASHVIFSVRDHGIGIAPQDVERIFHRFERAVSARHFGGLGLGLFVVQQIVQAHGGTIRVDSQLGAGSTFTVRLPRRPELYRGLPDLRSEGATAQH